MSTGEPKSKIVQTPVVETPITIDDKKGYHLAKASYSFIPGSTTGIGGYPFGPDDVDKLDNLSDKTYQEMIDVCRFFYMKDPLAATAINKMIEIGINGFNFSKKGLTDNELRIFKALEPKLQEFAENMALEYLISGLVVPEISYTTINQEEIKSLDIKKYSSLVMPTSMWLRDPKTIFINQINLGGESSYYVQVPGDMVYFILHKGIYPDGTKDTSLYYEMVSLYPDFVTRVENGETKILLDNPLIFKRRTLTNSSYPIPYLSPAIEAMEHKRNLRRMDYSIASRVVSAIQLITLGSDEFPVTQEEGEDVFSDIRSQLQWRDGTRKNMDRIYQLFANHTLKISWVFPDTKALLDDAKYNSVNEDIIYALGFPTALIAGESRNHGSGDPVLNTKSPESMMESIRNKILPVIKSIAYEVSKRNKLTNVPGVEFTPLNMVQFKDFIAALGLLYTAGNLSRESYANFMGYDINDELDKKEAEQKILKEKQLGEFAPAPFSNAPAVPGQAPANTSNGQPPKMMSGAPNNQNTTVTPKKPKTPIKN
jgi:hypothetical protein